MNLKIEEVVENNQDTEFSSFGAMLIKPDAVNLGIAEEIIAHVTHKLEEERIGNLEGVFIIDAIVNNRIPLLYPDLPLDGHAIVVDYLTEGSCVLVTFAGNDNISQRIKDIKGRRMMDWSIEELIGGIGIGDSIRAIMPVPGTKQLYDPIIEKIIARKSDPEIRLTQEEFRIYCRNLVHSPDNLAETLGLLTLLNDEQRSQILNDSQQEIFSEYISGKEI